MKTFVRTLLLCLLLLALPFQAFAAASMLPHVGHPGASLHEAAAAELPPCHRQMAMTMSDAAAPDHAAVPAGKHDAGEHAKGKCGAGAACCVGAALASSLPAALALAPPSTASIPFRAGHLPSVDPVLPERPPSTLLA